MIYYMHCKKSSKTHCSVSDAYDAHVKQILVSKTHMTVVKGEPPGGHGGWGSPWGSHDTTVMRVLGTTICF